MNTKRILSLVLCLLLSFSCIAFADETASAKQTESVDLTELYDDSADELYVYGLFKGGSNGFDLGGESNKAQAAVMIVRLIGAEDNVLGTSYSHPYADVPAWASNYVGYLYQSGIDIADEETVFGANSSIDLDEFLLLVTESLGYRDVDSSSEKEEIESYVADLGILSNEEIKTLSETSFCRGMMAYIARKALDTNVAGFDMSLYTMLSQKGTIKELPEPDDTVKYGTVQSVVDAVEEAAAPQTQLGDDIVSYGQQYLGIRYRSGGKTPQTGFDCSGFVGYVMVQNGVWSSHPGSCDGIASRCQQISMSEARPGDIVLFTGTYKTSKRYTHTGIYMGNGMIIHSASSSGVSVSSITSGYWANHYSCIVRPTSLM